MEFTTEPFDLGEPRHALLGREVIEAADLDAVDVGSSGSTTESGCDAVLTAVDALLCKAVEVGATRVPPQVDVIGEEEMAEDLAEARIWRRRWPAARRSGDPSRSIPPRPGNRAAWPGAPTTITP